MPGRCRLTGRRRGRPVPKRTGRGCARRSEHGWDARFYGADLPLEYALASALSWKPDAIGLSVSVVYHLPRLRGYVDAFGRLPREPAILLGGRLTEPYLAHGWAAERVVPTPGLLELSEWLAADMERGARRTSRELSGR